LVPEALLAIAAAPAAKVTVPVLVYVSPDDELIRPCDRVVAIDAKKRAILAAYPEEDDGGPLEPKFDALTEE
jgi:hypothetical protein